MQQERRPSFTRREFIADGSDALVITALSFEGLSQAKNNPQKLKIAIVGTGSRGLLTWGKAVVENYSDVVEIVGLRASLVGIAAYQSSERAGQAVKIADLVKLSSG